MVLQGGLVSNSYEDYLANLCLRKNKPVIGICAGFDCLLRTTVHSLILNSDYSDMHWNVVSKNAHKIVISKNSILHDCLGVDELSVNSVHKTVIFPDSVKKNLAYERNMC